MPEFSIPWIYASLAPADLLVKIPDWLNLHMQGLNLAWEGAHVLNQDSKDALVKCKAIVRDFEGLLPRHIPSLLDMPGGCVVVDFLFGRQTFDIDTVPMMVEWWHSYCKALCAGKANLAVLGRAVRYVPQVLDLLVQTEPMPRQHAVACTVVSEPGGSARDIVDWGTKPRHGPVSVVQLCCREFLMNESVSDERSSYFSGALELLLKVCPKNVLMTMLI